MPVPAAKPVLIIKTGDTYPEIEARFGDFDRWFIGFFQAHGLMTETVEVHQGHALPTPGEVSAVLVTGSPAMVSHREAWSEYSAEWLKHYVAVGGLVLGVCYGHQLLAHALGGHVDNHPRGREIGTLPVRLSEAGQADSLLGALPSSFVAHLTHRQSVLELPPSAVLLASSQQEPNQAFRVGHRCWGVQFHPEFTPDIMCAYLDRHRSQLEQEGVDIKPLYEDAREGAPDAAHLLDRFARLISQG